MSKEEERQSPAKMEGAVGENTSKMVVLGLDSPSGEKHPDFPIVDMFPTDIESMENYQEILKKYINSLRDLLEKQKDSVKEFAENQGIPWDRYVQLRKKEVLANTNLNDPAGSYMENWKDENFLSECHRTIMHIQWTHLCRWTLHKKIEIYYKENKNALRLPAHSKEQTSEDLEAFDGDSASHKAYVRNKRDEEEFLEKTAVLVFNRLGASFLTERQIRSVETVMEKLLKEREYRFVKDWTDEVVKMTRETSDQTLADVPSISLDDSQNNSGANSEGPTIPPTPNPSYASDMESLSQGGTLSRIKPLPKDSSTEDESSFFDKSEEIDGCLTGECTGDELTSPEDPTHKRKSYTHTKTHRDNGNVDDTE